MSKHNDDRTHKNRKGNLENLTSPGRSDQDANADKGGTTDMDSQIRKDTRNSAGSGISTKTSVTGSDFDGQVVDQ